MTIEQSNQSIKSISYTNLIYTKYCALRSCRILNTTIIYTVYTNGKIIFKKTVQWLRIITRLEHHYTQAHQSF